MAHFDPEQYPAGRHQAHRRAGPPPSSLPSPGEQLQAAAAAAAAAATDQHGRVSAERHRGRGGEGGRQLFSQPADVRCLRAPCIQAPDPYAWDHRLAAGACRHLFRGTRIRVSSAIASAPSCWCEESWPAGGHDTSAVRPHYAPPPSARHGCGATLPSRALLGKAPGPPSHPPGPKGAIRRRRRASLAASALGRAECTPSWCPNL